MKVSIALQAQKGAYTVKMFRFLLRWAEFIVMLGICFLTALVQTVYEKLEMRRINNRSISVK